MSGRRSARSAALAQTAGILESGTAARNLRRENSLEEQSNGWEKEDAEVMQKKELHPCLIQNVT